MNVGLRRTLLLTSLAVSLFSSACAHRASRGSGPIKIDRFDLDYKVYGPSVPGRFLIPVVTARGQDKPGLPRNEAQLVSLESDGRVKTLKVVRSRFRNITVMDARPVEPGIYGYFTCDNSTYVCSKSDLRFVKLDGTDVELAPTPRPETHLNFHDFERMPNGNLVYIFSNYSTGIKTIDNRIQEWDSKGRVVFNWNFDDHLEELATTDRTVHINSVEADASGDLWISVPRLDTVYKIEKRSGRVTERISHRDWKFPNDPLKGFHFQHTVRILPNGNLLLFDNGDKAYGRPSRAAEYRLEFASKTATLVWEYRMPADDITYRQIGGSVQRLSNGNTLISWGSPERRDGFVNGRIFTEVDPRGNVVRELKGPILTFRVSFEES